ncbi:MAG: ACT domain-containing protein [Anaerolineales bacterium]|nr:ACT domain-containing protein [Anaerolineales bacterium]
MNVNTDIPLSLLPERLAVCRLAADAPFPEWARPGDLLALVRTREELSVVCNERYVPPEIKAERGWRALQAGGPLDFSLVGVLASIAGPLAEAGVSIFALSTYETDYVLVKESFLERALEALDRAGFLVIKHVHLPA